MEKVMKIVIKFNFSEKDILLHKHYKVILDALQKELGNKVTVMNGPVHRGYHRRPKGMRKWEEVIYHDLIIIYSKDVEEEVLKAVS